VPDLLLVKV